VCSPSFLNGCDPSTHRLVPFYTGVKTVVYRLAGNKLKFCTEHPD
jgi:hypothetical protein